MRNRVPDNGGWEIYAKLSPSSEEVTLPLKQEFQAISVHFEVRLVIVVEFQRQIRRHSASDVWSRCCCCRRRRSASLANSAPAAASCCTRLHPVIPGTRVGLLLSLMELLREQVKVIGPLQQLESKRVIDLDQI